MRKILTITFVAIVIVTLTGCLYPQGELAKNKMPNEEQLKMVQNAVEKYQEDFGGLVPIKTKDSDTSIYEKYLIDFALLKDEQYIDEIPGTAYENGGVYQYTIVNPDEEPQVKLLDLRMTEQLRSLNVKLHTYRSKHGHPPFGKQIEKGIFQINHKKLGYDAQPHVVSPFTNNNLPFVMDYNGDTYIDYRIDLKEAMDEYPTHFSEGEDIRSILTDNYHFVPAYSLPYTIENGDPVFLKNDE